MLCVPDVPSSKSRTPDRNKFGFCYWYVVYSGEKHAALTSYSHICLSDCVSSVWMLRISTCRLPTIPARNAGI